MNETNIRDVRKLKWQYKVRNMPKKRSPAIADRAVWEKVTKARAGIRWDSVVEKVWKDIGGHQEEMLSIEKFAGYKTEIKERMDARERPALRNNGNHDCLLYTSPSPRDLSTSRMPSSA